MLDFVAFSMQPLPKICNNNHSIRGMIYTDIYFFQRFIPA